MCAHARVGRALEREGVCWSCGVLVCACMRACVCECGVRAWLRVYVWVLHACVGACVCVSVVWMEFVCMCVCV